MACKIPYIENALTNSDRDTIERLEEKHVNTFKELMDSRLFKVRNSQLILGSDQTVRLKEQKELIDKINAREENPIIFVENNTIKVNVLNNEEEGSRNLDPIFQTYPKYKRILKDEKYDPSLSSIEGKLQNFTYKMLDTLDSQIKISDKRKTKSNKNIEFNKQLNEMRADLKQFEHEDQLKGVVRFVKYMKQQLDYLNKAFDERVSKDIDNLDILHRFESYTAAYSLIDDIQDLYADSSLSTKILSKNDKKLIEKELSNIKGSYEFLNKKYIARNRNLIKDSLNNKIFHSEIVYKYRQLLKREYNDLYPNGKDRDEWVNKKLNSEEYQKLIEDNISEKLDSLLYDIGDDISATTKILVDDLNTNSKLIQIVSHVLSEIRDNTLNRTRETNFELSDLHDEFIKGKNSSDLNKLYQNIIQKDSDGKVYLYSKYNPEFMKIRRDMYQKVIDAEKKFGTDSSDYNFALKDYYDWYGKNTKRIKGKKGRVPSDKWLSKERTLSEIEQKVLDKFKEISKRGELRTNGYSSLVNSFGEADFYSLPSITKSDLERVISDKKIGGVFKDKIKDLTQLRPDDIGYQAVPTTINNIPVKFIPVHYRGKINPKDQSLDLFTLYALDNKNTISFQEKNNKELELNAISEIAKSKKYHASQGLSKKKLRSIFGERVGTVLLDGKNSNTYQKIEGMIENQLYDIANKYAGEIIGTDINKLTYFFNGITASLGMSANFIGGWANVITGNINTALEAIAGDKISTKDLKKAYEVYIKHLPGSIGDIGNPVKKAYINQINEMFDVFGDANVLGHHFIKSNKFKKLMDSSTLTFQYAAGEHEIQSVLALAVLNSVKVMNENSEFIDKNGNHVTKEKAASLLDMLKIKDNKLYMDEKVVYTEFNPIIKYNEGGKVQINNFIKKKLFDTQGVYDNRHKSEFQRQWYGTLAFLFRRYLISSVQRRFKGFETLTRIEKNADGKASSIKINKREDLAENELHWNDAIQDYDEGVYTSTLRFLFSTFIPAVKRLQFKLITTDWKNISDLEKGNIRRAIVELSLVGLMMIGARAFHALGDDDEENERLYYNLAYQFRRQESEIAQYFDINEAWRIFQSPAAAIRTTQNLTRNVYLLLQPWDWADTYESGKHKGDLKIKHYMIDLIPALNKLDVTAKESYNWFDR